MLGHFLVPMPTIAQEGDRYAVAITEAAANYGLERVCVDPDPDDPDAVAYVCGEYVVADTFPADLVNDLNGDGDADDCREFGDEVTDWMDVVSAFYCYSGIAGPAPGSARWSAMDCYPIDETDDTCAVIVPGGDGVIDWMDVVATFYYYRGDMPCQVRRPCGS
jgi:hypothetical protein